MLKGAREEGTGTRENPKAVEGVLRATHGTPRDGPVPEDKRK